MNMYVIGEHRFLVTSSRKMKWRIAEYHISAPESDVTSWQASYGISGRKEEERIGHNTKQQKVWDRQFST